MWSRRRKTSRPTSRSNRRRRRTKERKSRRNRRRRRRAARPAAPSKERVAVGHYIAGRPSILVQRQAGRGAWKRVVPNDPISTTDDLVSLPGYSSELDLDGGAHVLLRGNVREFSFAFPIMDFLMESAVKLHKPEAGFDADLTLDRGRIYLSNHRRQGPVKVRLRFADEVWDLTLLDADTEIGVDPDQGLHAEHQLPRRRKAAGGAVLSGPDRQGRRRGGAARVSGADGPGRPLLGQ